jgi:TetR/AcrR family transcriptional regulator, tetracycline repressor protein
MPLDRPMMIAAALDLLDEFGLDGLTLRRLASRLDVQAPAIYWHFKNKQELLDEMASAVLRVGIRQLPVAGGVKWDKWAMAYGKGLRRILLLHRDGAKMVSGTRLTDNSLYAPMELALRTLAGAGFSSYLSLLALSTIYSYTVGFVIEEQAVCPRPGERDEFYGPQQRGQRVDADKFPLALKAGDHLFSSFDRRFEDGLKLIVAGIAARKPAAPRRRGS